MGADHEDEALPAPTRRAARLALPRTQNTISSSGVARQALFTEIVRKSRGDQHRLQLFIDAGHDVPDLLFHRPPLSVPDLGQAYEVPQDQVVPLAVDRKREGIAWQQELRRMKESATDRYSNTVMSTHRIGAI